MGGLLGDIRRGMFTSWRYLQHHLLVRVTGTAQNTRQHHTCSQEGGIGWAGRRWDWEGRGGLGEGEKARKEGGRGVRGKREGGSEGG